MIVAAIILVLLPANAYAFAYTTVSTPNGGNQEIFKNRSDRLAFAYATCKPVRLMETTAVELSHRIAVSDREAAALLGVGRDAVRAAIAGPVDPLPSFKFGNRLVIPTRELVEWAGRQTAKENTPR